MSALVNFDVSLKATSGKYDPTNMHRYENRDPAHPQLAIGRFNWKRFYSLIQLFTR
jgi:hypothetical protein